MQVVSGPMGKERVHFEEPAAPRVEKEMTAFLDWFNPNGDLDPVMRAGLAHLWFVSIHPFDDGNGRIARSHRRHGSCAFGKQSAALLQHVGANPAGAHRLLRHP